jgi:uncharacterized protein YecA (UPF0149 family)
MNCETGEILSPDQFRDKLNAIARKARTVKSPERREILAGEIRHLKKKYIEMTCPPTEAQMRRKPPKVGRNDPCPCGSGLKFKRCHLMKKYLEGKDESR